jgi:hypothetical protein
MRNLGFEHDHVRDLAKYWEPDLAPRGEALIAALEELAALKRENIALKCAVRLIRLHIDTLSYLDTQEAIDLSILLDRTEKVLS